MLARRTCTALFNVQTSSLPLLQFRLIIIIVSQFKMHTFTLLIYLIVPMLILMVHLLLEVVLISDVALVRWSPLYFFVRLFSQLPFLHSTLLTSSPTVSSLDFSFHFSRTSTLCVSRLTSPLLLFSVWNNPNPTRKFSG